MFSLWMLGIIFVCVAAIAMTALMHLWLGAPYVPTPISIVRTMVACADLKPGQTVIDLGAGDCRLLIEAKRMEPAITAIGYEVVPTVWLLGWLRILCSRQTISLRLRDARKADLRSADCVFLYLLPGVLTKLMPVLDRDLRPNSLVISSVFPLPGRTPIREVDVAWMGGMRKVRVYRWTGSR